MDAKTIWAEKVVGLITRLTLQSNVLLHVLDTNTQPFPLVIPIVNAPILVMIRMMDTKVIIIMKVHSLSFRIVNGRQSF